MKRDIEEYLVHLKALGRAWRTRRTCTRILFHFSDFVFVRFDVGRTAHVTRHHLESYLARLAARGFLATTISGYFSVISGFFRWARRSGKVLFDAAADIEFPRVRGPLPKNILSEREVRDILHAIDITKPVGVRNRAILELLYSTGLRRGELAELDLRDVDIQNLTVTVRCGKGGKGRVVPLGRLAAHWLKRYLSRVRPKFLGKGSDYQALFVTADGGRRMTGNSFGGLFTRINEKRPNRKKISCHGMRHTFATHMLRGGADIRVIQRILGHANLETTQIYTRVVQEDLKRVHRRTHPRGRMRV